MELFQLLIGFFLSLAGYSSGSVIVTKNRPICPNLIDFFVVIFLWLGVIMTQDSFGRWLDILVWIGGGVLVGVIVMWIRIRLISSRNPSNLNDSELEISLGVKQKWSLFIKNFGNYQTRVLLMFVYFIFLLPFGVGVRLFSDPLAIRQLSEMTGWVNRVQREASIDEAGRQF